MNTEKIQILTAENQFFFKAISDTGPSVITYSFPLSYGNQTPLAFEITGDFLSYKIIQDKQKLNQNIKFELPSLNKNETKKINFKYWVLTKNINYEKLEKKEYLPIQNRLPDSVKKWLVPTNSIQINNIFLKIIARFIQGFSKDMFWFSKKAVFWISYHGIYFNFLKKFLVTHPTLHKLFLPDAYWYPLEDALSALLFGGICAAEANLLVAILRARGVPARLLITTSLYYGKDQWMDSQHYITEIFFPRYGWIRAQSGRIPIQEESDIILKIVEPEDENLAGNGFSKFGGMVPWFSFDNQDIVFDVPQGYMNFKLPESKKVGFPVIRAWKEKEIEINKEDSDELFRLTN